MCELARNSVVMSGFPHQVFILSINFTAFAAKVPDLIPTKALWFC